MGIKFEKCRVYNFMGAIRNMRNSWESWDKSDSSEGMNAIMDYFKDLNIHNPANVEYFLLGHDDRALAMKLSRAGSDHAKFLRQIMVSVDITAGNDWWKEADTYKVGTVANSTSMMHKLGSRLLTGADFSFDDSTSYIARMTVDLANQAIQRWRATGKVVGSPEWRDMQKCVGMGFVYRRGFTCNYQVLKNMYHSRKMHRLAEWREFAAWVESLPYSELITLKEVGGNDE